MEFITSGFKMPCFVGIAGACVLLICFELGWLAPNGIDVSISGIDLVEGEGHFSYSFTPLLAAICGIVGLIAMVLPLFIHGGNTETFFNVLAIAMLILSVATIVCALLFSHQTIMSVKISDLYHMEVGFWLAIVGSAFSIFGAVMHFVRVKFM